MVDNLWIYDGTNYLYLIMCTYDTKYKEVQNKQPSWRRFNSVKYFCVYDGPFGKEIFKNRHISTFDIERLYIAANAVLSGKQNRVRVASKKRDLRLTMAKELDRYSMSIEILTDRGMISLFDNDMDLCIFADKCAKLSGWKRAFPVLSDQELRQVYKTRPERHVTEDGMGTLDVPGDNPELPVSLDDLFDGLDDDFNDFDLD